MANKIITFVLDTLEPELNSAIAAAVDELHNLGHTIKEIRLMDDAGEQKIPVNTVPGVTVHEPVPQVTVPAPAPEPAPEPAPVPEPPAPAPVDPTPAPAPVDPTPAPDPAPVDVPVDTPPTPTPTA